ncbi:MAG: hypothetical protein ACLQBA_26470 [Candidatus Binataceae bacterium]
MAEQVSDAEEKFPIDPLGWRGALHEVIKALAAAVGLSLLWGLENLRNAFFGLLDRMNLKPWARKGSAFPPGRPRKLKN